MNVPPATGAAPLGPVGTVPTGGATTASHHLAPLSTAPGHHPGACQPLPARKVARVPSGGRWEVVRENKSQPRQGGSQWVVYGTSLLDRGEGSRCRPVLAQGGGGGGGGGGEARAGRGPPLGTHVPGVRAAWAWPVLTSAAEPTQRLPLPAVCTSVPGSSVTSRHAARVHISRCA